MYIHHAAIWTHDLEALKSFYETYFEARAGEKYVNPTKGFESYYLCFDSGAMLEIMQMPGIPESKNDALAQSTGLTHLALSTGSKECVDTILEKLEKAGQRVIGRPRWTGDGYYEAVILDPDSNRIEITS